MPRVYHSGVIYYLFMLLDSKVDLFIFVVYNGNTCGLIECQFCVHSMIPYVRICLSSTLIATEYSLGRFYGGGGTPVTHKLSYFIRRPHPVLRFVTFRFFVNCVIEISIGHVKICMYFYQK
jgi:hypothetical protein